jgi:hypothetical protein
MEIKEVVQFLLENKYIVCHKGKYKVTERFYEEVTGTSMGLIIPADLNLQVAMPIKDQRLAWPTRYLNFIKECDIPRYGQSSNGGQYELNKYSQDGCKAFQKALEKYYLDYDLLVKTVKLYYKSKVGLKQSITTYMQSESYLSDYKTLLESAQQGEEALKQHLKQSTQNDNGTAYEQG